MIPPQQQPDVAGAVLALDQAMIALAVAKSTLLGETSRPIHASERDLAAAQASPANPYGSTAGPDEGVKARTTCDSGRRGYRYACNAAEGHDGDHIFISPVSRKVVNWPRDTAAEVAEGVEPLQLQGADIDFGSAEDDEHEPGCDETCPDTPAHRALTRYLAPPAGYQIPSASIPGEGA